MTRHAASPHAPIAALIMAALFTACAQSFDPPPTPALIASMPDTIPCEKAVQVKAGSEERGIRAERRWLDAYYPGHSAYRQALKHEGSKSYDILDFQRANGQQASVCFDITAFFGHW